jgi:hypothetical protein
MYFLNGDRIYIKPNSGCGTRDEQLQNCLQQLTKINSGKKIFKLNFFVDTASDDDYQEFQQHIRNEVARSFFESIILGFFAQPPLTCKIIVEAFFYETALWQAEFILEGTNAAIKFQREETEILIGTVQANLQKGCRKNAETAFAVVNSLFSASQFQVNSIVRQWNYLEEILDFDGEKQHYQEFNNVRSDFYGNAFDGTGYPAATGIGMNRGGVIIEFVAVKSNNAFTVPVDNPGQVAAHHYSKNVLIGNDCVLKTTPKFERARYLELFDKKQIFISGTASIVGEKTVGIDDPAKQTEVTIQNIQRLYSDEVLEKVSKIKLNPKYGHARVYIKRRKDFPVIKKTFKIHFGNLPVVYIVADICRESLLVEIEGKVILE